jgi:hypothetical protein
MEEPLSEVVFTVAVLEYKKDVEPFWSTFLALKRKGYYFIISYLVCFSLYYDDLS